MRLAVCLAFLLLTACGQSGDLYLPDEAAPAGAASGPAAPTPPAEKDPEDDR